MTINELQYKNEMIYWRVDLPGSVSGKEPAC